jgi:cytochrome o ubiquinol oxidase operon protein cyoD
MNKNAKHEHGTTQSYFVGFVLSWAFTVMPYYLVVTKSVSGTALLATILGFAVLQMAIQILFFLHLGRGPKPLYNVVFFAATVGIIVIVITGSLFIMSHLHYNMVPSEVSKNLAEKEAIYQVEGAKTGACQEVYANHQVIIKNGRVNPLNTEARLCDSLTFINEDNVVRDIAFGTHPQHLPYAGESDLTARKGRPKTITLNSSGIYLFHDHLHPQTTGRFTVAPQQGSLTSR